MDTTQRSPSKIVQNLIDGLHREFSYRTKIYSGDSRKFEFAINSTEFDVLIDMRVNQSAIFSLRIPIPYIDENGNTCIGEITPRCPGWWVVRKKKYDYVALIYNIMVTNMNYIFNMSIRSTPIARLCQMHTVHNPGLVVRNIQGMINTIVNSVPLSQAPLQDAMMNQRISFLDPDFEGLTPEEKLNYQVQKELDFFPLTGLGLSDSAASDGNHLLARDARDFTPFCGHHNPARNLYSTYGMKGDETALIRTKSEVNCSAQRTGFNWVTAFLDLPGNYEDQLIINPKHLEKIAVEKRKFSTFGIPAVFIGEKILPGRTLSVELDGNIKSFDVLCDYGIVKDIYKNTTSFDGRNITSHVIVMELYRKYTDGYKFTNRHGNKGVCIFAPTGFAVDPVTNKLVEIDIIVSAKSVLKRKNYGQILEALANNINRGSEMVVNDRQYVRIPELQSKLMNMGYPEDLTCEIRSNYGKKRAIVGNVFWGFIKSTEDQIWTERDLESTKSNGTRRAGLKISAIELRSLATIFGKDFAPVFKEISSHSAGTDEVAEQIKILKSSVGQYDAGLPVIDMKHIKPVKQESGSFLPNEEDFDGTIADVTKFNRAFLLKLPFTYYTRVTNRGKVEHFSVKPTWQDNTEEILETDKIYVPGPDVRRCWRHGSGYYGMSEVSVRLNNIIDFYHRELNANGEEVYSDIFGAINSYFYSVAASVSSKKGSLSQNVVSVRYQNSSKGVATQNPSLPKNHISIHRSMAEQLGVKEKEVVIVERFPCLGFPSMRLQRILINDDPNKKYVIQVSRNSLVSQGLDFDGDVIYIMAFKTLAAKNMLEKHFNNPNKKMEDALETINNKIVPIEKEMGLGDYEICSFEKPTKEQNAECIAKLTGVKLHTGPIISLCYDLSRIIESSVSIDDELNFVAELLLDKVANSVFALKHGKVSLQEQAIEAICLADVDKLMGLFDGSGLDVSRKEISRIADIIIKEAHSVGVRDLEAHFEAHKTEGRSNILKEIVRKKHPIYFASRASLNPYRFIKCLQDKGGDRDLVSAIVDMRLKRHERGING